jgi:hypothetical protein
MTSAHCVHHSVKHTLMRPLLLVAVAALVACASAEDLQRTIDLNVDAAVQSTLTKLAKPRVKTVSSADLTVESRNSGNFNVPVRSDASISWTYGADGLVRERKLQRSGTWVVEQLSACGLLVATRESTDDGRGKSAGTTAVVTGGVAVAAPMAGMLLEHRLKVSTVSADATLCSPQPGAPFKATVTASAQKKMLGTALSFNRFYDISVWLTCAPGADVTPASTIHPALSGAFLKVTCEIEPSTEFLPKSAEYAFLLDYGIYVPLSVRVTSAQVDSYVYKRIAQ